jgi:hypothetical protein
MLLLGFIFASYSDLQDGDKWEDTSQERKKLAKEEKE